MNHKLYTVKDIEKMLGAVGRLHDLELKIKSLSTDSRKINDPAQSLFFALKGRRDGHDFIADVHKSGVRNFVVSNSTLDTSGYSDSNFFFVTDTLRALQLLAAGHRSQFSYPVIAITGSNGKTIVKEWLYQLLAYEHTIVRSPKSFNSQIGVPLSVWQMNDSHTLGIFETGISKTGEMATVQEVLRPTIGILTNIGEAHNEGFASREEKIKEKLLLFKDVDLFIYSSKYLEGYTGTIPGKKQFSWGEKDDDLHIIDEEVLENKYQYLRASYNGEEIQCAIPFTDAASIENAICCWATMLAMGYDPQTADTRLEKLQPVKMRLELKNGINNSSIIDDSYSSDLSSLAIALDFLNQQNQHSKRTLILSDIPEGGISSDDLYTQVSQLIDNKDVSRLIGVGPELCKHSDLFDVDKRFYSTTDELLANLPEIKIANETVLLKGARVFEFERISKALTQKMHETVLEINLNALENNLNHYKSMLQPGVKVMAMVKAFSYGSGSFEIANILQFNKADYLAVAYADEGVALRKAGISLPMMVMNADEGEFDPLIEHHLEPEIYSLRLLKGFIEVLDSKVLENYPVHIKLDTGMHRLGFMHDEIDDFLEVLSTTKTIKVRSVFSHLVGSEDKSLDDFTKQQLTEFKEMADRIEAAVNYKFIRHISNSSAISRWPEAQLDMVRLGIGLYGIDSSFTGYSPLSTVTALKTSISQIKSLKPGDTVGYNRKGVLPTGGKIATIKIGYADGYHRKLGNGVGRMLINDHIVPTIGNICMDMCMLDITGLDVKEGDEVVVFNETIKVEDIARQLETIPYEVLTGISQRVKRVYYYE